MKKRKKRKNRKKRKKRRYQSKKLISLFSAIQGFLSLLLSIVLVPRSKRNSLMIFIQFQTLLHKTSKLLSEHWRAQLLVDMRIFKITFQKAVFYQKKQIKQSKMIIS